MRFYIGTDKHGNRGIIPVSRMKSRYFEQTYRHEGLVHELMQPTLVVPKSDEPYGVIRFEHMFEYLDRFEAHCINQLERAREFRRIVHKEGGLRSWTQRRIKDRQTG